jgi:hypothetical protein
MKTSTYVPPGTTNLNFQLQVPTGSFVLADIKNNAPSTSQAVTLTTNTSNYPTLNP